MRLVLIVLLAGLASIPAAFSQEALVAEHLSIKTAISEEGDVDVVHEIRANPAGTVTLQLLDRTATDLRVSYKNGDAAEYTAGNGTLSLAGPIQNIIVQYTLPGAVTEEDGYLVWHVRYVGDVNIRLPEGIDLVYANGIPVLLNGKEIACHGCNMALQYVHDEPRILHDAVWEDQEFEVEFITTSEISPFVFDQPSMRISFGAEADRFVTAVIPTGLLGPPYGVFLDGERIRSDDSYSNDEVGRITFRPASSGTVDIIGATVVPEFSLLIPLVVGVAMVAAMRGGRLTLR